MSLTTYQHDLLPHDEFVRLILLAQAGDENARNTIIEKNVRLVIKIALAAHKRLACDLEDIIQYGLFGLFRSIEKYDPTMLNKLTQKSFAFSTYATWWIRQTIDREVAMYNPMIRLPIHLVKRFAKYRMVTSYMMQAGIPLTDTNFDREAEDFKFSDSELGVFRQPPNVYSETSESTSNKGQSYEGGFSYYDNTVDDHSDFAHEYEQQDFYTNLLQICKEYLTTREYLVLQYLFGLNGYEAMTLEEAGDLMNCTRERVRQIQENALRKLRAHYKIQLGDEYVETALG